MNISESAAAADVRMDESSARGMSGQNMGGAGGTGGTNLLFGPVIQYNLSIFGVSILHSNRFKS